MWPEYVIYTYVIITRNHSNTLLLINLQKTKTCPSHPATRRCGDVVTMFLCTSLRRRRYVSNETPNDVSMELRQDVSAVRPHNVLLEHRDDVSRGRNNDVPSVHLHDVSNKSQMKYPTTSQWYVSTTSH